MTYEGLIDEIFKIEGNIAKIPANLLDDNVNPNPNQQQASYKNIQFNSEKDYIY